MSLEELISAVFSRAKDIIEKEGEDVLPIGFVVGGGSFGIIPLDFSDDKAKRLSLMAFKAMLQKADGEGELPRIDAYAIVSEAWAVVMDMKDGKVPDLKGIQPSAHKERIEILMVQGQDRAGRAIMRQAYIERRSDGSRKLHEAQGMDTATGAEVHGALANLFGVSHATN